MKAYDFDVLVVDDVAQAAEDYGRLIQARTGFKVIWTSLSEEAEELVRQSDIKVVVLDQVMPVRGTELMQRLKKINPQLKTMMLTGEASGKEIGQAINLNFDKYLDKADVKELPGYVRSLYTDYQCEFYENLTKLAPKFLRITWKGIYYLLSKEKINSSYADERQTRTLLNVFAGEEQERVTENVVAEEVIYDTTEEVNVGFDLNVNPTRFPIIKAAYRNILNLKKSIRTTKRSKEITKYKLPEKLEETISHRIIECTPVYEVYKVVLGYKRFLFQKMERGVVIMKVFTGKHHLCQTDHMHDGNTIVQDLGVHEI